MTTKKSGKQKGLTSAPVEKAGVCPVCGCDDLEYRDTDYDNDGMVGYLYICMNDKCAFEGVEWNVMHFDAHTDRSGNPIKKG